MTKKILMFVSSMALMTLLSAAPANAQPGYPNAYLTFSAPITLPGVTLPAGTYWFKFVAPSTIRVSSEDRTQVYATLTTVPVMREHASESHEVTFRETPAGQPKAIHAWFRPNAYFGNAFLYHEPRQPMLMARK
jgi:hypothetical protein